MIIKEGKYTVETFARQQQIKRQSALNLISKLKAKGLVQVSGGGKQKRIYSITKLPQSKTNGFYNIVNKYSPEKLVPKFQHITRGNYSIEHAVIDGIQIGDIRTKNATMHLFNHITNWKRLFDLAKKKNCEKEVYELYKKARRIMKCRTMPKRYHND